MLIKTVGQLCLKFVIVLSGFQCLLFNMLRLTRMNLNRKNQRFHVEARSEKGSFAQTMPCCAPYHMLPNAVEPNEVLTNSTGEYEFFKKFS